MANAVRLTVPDELGGERVDKAIAALLEISRARSVRVVANGVSLDGLPAKGSDRVTASQVLVCTAPDEVGGLVPEPVDFEVRFEDPHTLVVDKPPGVVVHPGVVDSPGTLAAGLLYRYPELEGVGQRDRWGLVHRLDKDTSGLILVARNEESYQNLSDQLRRRAVTRKYRALVEGRLGAPTGTVDAPIARDPTRPTRRALSHTGKPARTHFEIVEYFADADCSLVEVTLETGRTHQIRVHMSSISHPVVGDRLYGATRRDIAVPRTFLHAARLGFDHPNSGERVEVISDLPPDLAVVLKRLSEQVSS